MSFTNSQAARIAATDAVVALINEGTGDGGTLRIRDGSENTLIDFELPDPAFGSAAGADGVATANAISDAEATATGLHADYQALDKDGNVIFTGPTGVTLAITGVDTGDNEIEVAGDREHRFPAGQELRIVDSTGNDGTYTVATGGASHDDGTTTIPVEESIENATADGSVETGDATLDVDEILSGNTISISSWTHQALSQ